jgi:hypothetical protein
MDRSELHEIDLSEVKKTPAVMTMSAGQWDRLLQAAYEAGWVLLELDAKERPVRAYRRALQ